MISLAKLKKDKEFMRDMEGIIDIFRTAALIQFRLFQGKEKASEDFLKGLESSLQLLEGRRISSRYIAGPEWEEKHPRKAIVLVTSDDGFLGGLNLVIIDAGMQRQTTKEDEIIVLGGQGARYLREKRTRFISFPGIGDDASIDRIERLRDYLTKGYYKRFEQVLIVYPKFTSLAMQGVDIVELLPYAPAAKRTRARKRRIEEEEMLVEPDIKSVVNIFIEMWMGHKLLEIFLSAKQSEYAARIMHLEGSLQQISHLKEELARAYFRQIHALQDKTIREISASKILLKRREIRVD